MSEPRLNSLEDGSQEEASVGSSHTTPNKLSHLMLPFSSQMERRASPRAEEVLVKKGRRPAKPQATRMRLAQYHSFEDAVDLLKGARKIVVLTGAGISTTVGIPDFRSDTGLYHKLNRDLGITTPEEFFSKEYFIDNTEEFFKYVRDVIPEVFPAPNGGYQPVSSKQKTTPMDRLAYVPKYSKTHAFLAFLDAQEKLLTNYTQNIDGLELAAGVPQSRFIQCHGSWNTASCMTCGKEYSAKKYLAVVFDNNKPMCKCSQLPAPRPSKNSRVKVGQKRKRRREEDGESDHSSDAYSAIPRGLLKPNITFFGDPVDPRYKNRLESDKNEVDLLLIIGTSLKVAPVQTMLYKIPAGVPQIYISKERFSGALCSLPGVQVDIELLGDADLIIGELCRRAGWTEAIGKWLWRDGMTRIHDSKTINKTMKDSRSKGGVQVNTEPKPPEQDQDLAMSKIFDGVPTSTKNVPAEQIPFREKSKIMDQSLSDHGDEIRIELEEGTTHRWRIRKR